MKKLFKRVVVGALFLSLTGCGLKASDVLATVKDVRQGEIDLEKAKAEGKKEAEAGYQGDPNASSPEAFLASLKPNEQGIVREMGTGQMPLNRVEYLAARNSALLEAVAKQKTQVDSVVALLHSIKTQLADALSGTKLPPDVEAKLALIMPQLEANTQEITDAINANTDPVPPAPPAPTPPTDTAPTTGSAPTSKSST